MGNQSLEGLHITFRFNYEDTESKGIIKKACNIVNSKICSIGSVDEICFITIVLMNPLRIKINSHRVLKQV